MAKRTVLLSLFTGAAVTALAGSAMSDPPGRVGRVAAVDGAVSFQPPGSDEWSWASRNYPVTDGESFWTGEGGRIELQVGGVDVRADSETEVDVPTLNYGEMRLALPQGSLDIRLWRAPEGGVIVSTPAGDVHLDQAGLYRVDVGAPSDDGSYPVVEVTTLEGEAGAPSPDGLAAVPAGAAAVVYAGYVPELQDAQYAAVDDWGRELEAREHTASYDRDDETGLTGYDELAAAGEFRQDPQYGKVWYPRDVPGDWAPYRYGHWSYVEPWGYTWVDDQSWGFAPFHYGRWAQIDERWAWIPGRPDPRPVYAPALVAFIGGEGWDLGGGGGAVGWVPLAPEEVYRPSYRVSDAYLRQVNVTNVRNTTVVNNLTISNTTVNTVAVTNYRNVAAATVVKSATFSGAAPVQRAALPVTPAVLARAPILAPASRPAPSPQARSGAPVAVAGRPAPTVAAARPPERIAAVRAAVVAPTAAPNKPPVIAGVHISPPAPRPNAGAAAPVLVAPAQVRNPAAQRAAAAAAPPLAAPAAATHMPGAPTARTPAPYAPPMARSPAPGGGPAGPSQTGVRARPSEALPPAKDRAGPGPAQGQDAAARGAAAAQAAQQAQAAQERARAAQQAGAARDAQAQARAAQARAAQERAADSARAGDAAKAKDAQGSARSAAEAQAQAAQQAQAAEGRARAAQQADAAREAQTRAKAAQERAAEAARVSDAARAREAQAAATRAAAEAQARAGQQAQAVEERARAAQQAGVARQAEAQAQAQAKAAQAREAEAARASEAAQAQAQARARAAKDTADKAHKKPDPSAPPQP